MRERAKKKKIPSAAGNIFSVTLTVVSLSAPAGQQQKPTWRAEKKIAATDRFPESRRSGFFG